MFKDKLKFLLKIKWLPFGHILYRLRSKKSIAFPRRGVRVEVTSNQYIGERCFIIGGGPSLSEINIANLSHEYTFAVNKGYLLKSKGLKNATFYCLADGNASKEYGEKIPSDFAKHYFEIGDGYFGDRTFSSLSSLAVYDKGILNKQLRNDFFQQNIEEPLAGARSVVLYALQIAVYLGFKDIYFVGVDNDFNPTKNMHWYKDSKQEKINIDRYLISPEKENSEAFAKARQFLSKKGVRIYNASNGGSLKTIPLVDYNKLFIK